MNYLISWLKQWLDAETMQDEGQIVDVDLWKTPPKDIMEMIGRRLNSTDYIRSSAVCKPWRSLLLQSDILRPRNSWLLIPHHPNDRTLKFFNLLERKFHTFVLPKPFHGGRIVGSSRGWLVMFKETQPSCEITACEIILFNPISGAKFRLPPLPSTLSLRRIELSSSDVSDCTAAAIFDESQILALYKPGNKRWEFLALWSDADIEEYNYALTDLMFCRQKLHILVICQSGQNRIADHIVKLRYGGSISIAFIYEVHDGTVSLTDIDDVIPFTGFRVHVRQCHISYLVESIKGSVLLIQKLYSTFYVLEEEPEMFNNFLDNFVDNDNGNDEAEPNEQNYDVEEEDDGDLPQTYTGVNRFNIFEIELEDSVGGERVRRRTNLGEEQTLFLSSHSRLCLPAAAASTDSHSNYLQGNRINFVMDHANHVDQVEPYLVGANAVYNPDDQGLYPLLPEHEFPWSTEFMWFEPNFLQ